MDGQHIAGVGKALGDVMGRAEAALSDEALAGSEEHSEPTEEVETAGDEPDQEESGVDEGSEAAEEDETPTYTAKTLPEGNVSLKIDGETVVVPLKELASGYMRQEVFHRRVQQLSTLKDQAERAAGEFKANEAKFREAFGQLVTDPDSMFEFLDEHAPDVLDAVSRKMLKRVIEEQNNPQARLEREYARRQERLERERDALRREKEERDRERTTSAETARYVSAFKPGFEAGMRRAGYPELTPELKATIRGIFSAVRESSGKVTPKDVEEAVVRAARAVGAGTVAERKPAPPPARVAPPSATRSKPQPKQQQRGGGSAKSFSQLFRDLGK